MRHLFRAVCLCLLACGISAGAEPKFKKGVMIEADGQPIDIRVGHLVPCATDWNGDGNKDLIVGQFSGGAISVYLNQGTNAAPEFKASTPLEAGGRPIHLAAG